MSRYGMILIMFAVFTLPRKRLPAPPPNKATQDAAKDLPASGFEKIDILIIPYTATQAVPL